MSDADPAVRRLIRAKRALGRAAGNLRGTNLASFCEPLLAMREHAEAEIQAIKATGKEPHG